MSDGMNALEKISMAYESKKKQINTAIVAILVAIGGFFGYKNFVQAPKEEKANLALMRAEQYYMMDSVSLALNGDPTNAGFLKITNKFSGTAAANIAHYYSGACFMQLGDYKAAIKHLDDFNPKGTILAHAKSGLLGDAYMEQGDTKKAIEHYKSATSDNEDEIYTPIYLQRIAIAYEKNNQLEEAKKAYEKLKNDFPRSMQSRDAEKHLAKLGITE
jgi:tetratricopeptide (TPR) repeat protein